MVEKIVFCDFDGTITTEDTFVKMLKKFTPNLAAKLLPEIYNLRLTLRDGVRQLMESIPSAKYPEILAFMQCETQRPGFTQFLDFLTAKNIKIVIISGGLKGIIEAILGDFKEQIYAIHAFDVDTTQPYLQVKSDYESDTELVSKVQVIKYYNVQDFVVIGDSITDLQMALYSPVVFARYPLTKYLDEKQKKYILWSDFYDIMEKLTFT